MIELIIALLIISGLTVILLRKNIYKILIIFVCEILFAALCHILGMHSLAIVSFVLAVYSTWLLILLCLKHDRAEQSERRRPKVWQLLIGALGVLVMMGAGAAIIYHAKYYPLTAVPKEMNPNMFFMTVIITIILMIGALSLLDVKCAKEKK